MSAINSRVTSVTVALQHWCRNSNKSMAAIASEAGFTSKQWQDIVDGSIRLDGMKVARVAAALGRDPVELGRVVTADYFPAFTELWDAMPDEVLRGDFSSVSDQYVSRHEEE